VPTGATSQIHAFLRSLRPEQWSKNSVVFAGLLFGDRLTQGPEYIVAAVSTFLVFCGLSGTVYIVNDIADRAADAGHPLKRRRPIAAGVLAPGPALAGAAVLAVTCLAAAFAISIRLGLVSLAYLGLLSLYSFYLKHLVILDVLTIAVGFVLRAVAGAVAVRVMISPWLLICVTLLAVFVSLAKRRHELTLLGESAGEHRPSLEAYSPYLLDQMISVVTAATLVAYIVYTTSSDTATRVGSGALSLTIPFVLYGLFRYLYLVHQEDQGGSPTNMLVTDRGLMVCVALWALSVGALLYHPWR
jgi:4-hydroxybenzoate polyprenyltransferase